MLDDAWLGSGHGFFLRGDHRFEARKLDRQRVQSLVEAREAWHETREQEHQ